MPPEDAQQQVNEQQQQAPETGNTPGAETPNSGAQQPAEKTFTQADIDRIIADRLVQERKKTESATAKAKADAERDAALKQGEFKTLYEKTLEQLQQAETARKTLETAQLQRQAADKVGLPSPLADRLRGETVEEMEADAKAILAALPKPTAPNLNNNQGGGALPRAGAMTDEGKRELAANLGINPKYIQ